MSRRTPFRSIVLNLYVFAVSAFILYHLGQMQSNLFPRNQEAVGVDSSLSASLDLAFPDTGYSLKGHSNLRESQAFKTTTSGSTELAEDSPPHESNNVTENRTLGDGKSAVQDDLSFNVTPLRIPIDYEKFTVRINTWKREEQLKLSIHHYMTCLAVAQIQIVWCLEQGVPPTWLTQLEAESNDSYSAVSLKGRDMSFPRIVIERHENNTLNERFLALSLIPTAGVLSVDDDVIRPCFALQATFVKWTLNPDRQVGFDARSHAKEIVKVDGVNLTTHKERWTYSYMSTTEKSNMYSITLTRYSFQHRDYLTSYWTDMPQEVRDIVAKNFNCEDIAMSLWISSRTNGYPPLLANYWAVKSQIKMYVSVKISGGQNHKEIRNFCFDRFADILGLKGRLHHAKLRHTTGKHFDYFEYGALAIGQFMNSSVSLPLRNETLTTLDQWRKKGNEKLYQELIKVRKEATLPIYRFGLLDGIPKLQRSI